MIHSNSALFNSFFDIVIIVKLRKFSYIFCKPSGELPAIEDELETNSAVMVIFTLSSYTNTVTILMHHQDCDNLNLNLSLNIQSVILLANADPTTDDLVTEEVEPFSLEVQPGLGNTSLSVKKLLFNEDPVLTELD